MPVTLLRQIAQVLIEDWDPLGVAIFPENTDEYDTQASHIAGRLNSPTYGREELASYLDDAAYEYSRSWDDADRMRKTIDRIWLLRGSNS